MNEPYYCSGYFDKTMEEERFNSPMPWVGLYVAAASLICSLALAADAFLCFRNKKLWFPCRFFTLNAATLTLLAVAMKLPVDLSTPMPSDIDQLSKLSSIVFMCTVMGNFMPLCSWVGLYVRYNSIMAETGSPQFVIGNSVTCCVSGAICILTALILVEAELRIYITYHTHGGIFNPLVPLRGQYSNYKWSTSVILVIQTIGLGIGTIAPAIRWSSDIKMKCSGKRGKTFTFEFKTEKYWTEKLEEWRENPLPFEIRSPKFKKLVHITRNLFLSFCIRVQIIIVVASKCIQLLFVSPIGCTVSSNHTGSELEYASNLNAYVLLLDGEKELPERMLKNILDAAHHLIQKGRKKQPKHLMKLLNKSVRFKGLAKFEPPNCRICQPCRKGLERKRGFDKQQKGSKSDLVRK